MVDNLVSGIFGQNAVASSEQDMNANSQSMDLLQAQVSSVSIVEDKKSDKEGVDLDKEIKIVADSALSPASSPVSISTPGIEDNGEAASEQVSVYVVRKGDSLAQIAEMFDVTSNTILWANDLKKGAKLVEGDTLFILPVSGVSHTVLKGQTLKGIAAKYNVDQSDIVQLNGIVEESKLAVGDELIIPNAEIVDTQIEKPKSEKTKTNSKVNTKNIAKKVLKSIIGYFTNPVPNYVRKSQGLHGNNSVDLAAPTGTTIVASASGTVLLARNGYNGGYGNMVIIKHPNGTETLYGHMSKLKTNTGDKVSQGETIGLVGSTGHSTGPHLHFEVHGASNPM